ncbi:MAG: hypothetical protein AAF449_16875, partial [Myxococcota bacterium]
MDNEHLAQPCIHVPKGNKMGRISKWIILTSLAACGGEATQELSLDLSPYGGQSLVLTREPLRFDSSAQMYDYLAAATASDVLRTESGQPIALKLNADIPESITVQGLTITDPVLAILGGLSDRIYANGAPLCVQSEDCLSSEPEELPAYVLEPGATQTRRAELSEDFDMSRSGFRVTGDIDTRSFFLGRQWSVETDIRDGGGSRSQAWASGWGLSTRAIDPPVSF